MKLSFPLAIAFAAFVALGRGAVAQISASDCTAAQNTLTSGPLVAADSQALALQVAFACGAPGVNAVAAAYRRCIGLSLSDPNAGRFFAAPVADMALMNAALDIASNTSTDAGVRTAMLGMLFGYAANRPPSSYAVYASLSEGDVCGGGAAAYSTPTPAAIYDYNNLPPNALTTMHARLASLERDAAQPLVVRAGANCIRYAWRYARRLPLQPIMSTSAPLQLEYVCRSRFRVKSSVPFVVGAQYRIGSGGPLVTFESAPKPPGASYGYYVIDTKAIGAPGHALLRRGGRSDGSTERRAVLVAATVGGDASDRLPGLAERCGEPRLIAINRDLVAAENAAIRAVPHTGLVDITNVVCPGRCAFRSCVEWWTRGDVDQPSATVMSRCNTHEI